MEYLSPLDYKEFYKIYYGKCFLFAKSYVHDDLGAEDIASESLIKLWELSQVQQIENPEKLLFIIIRNKALDYLRHEKIKRAAFDNLTTNAGRELEIRISTLESSNPEKIFASDIQNIITKSLSQLPKQTQDIFRKYRFQDLEKAEIANQLNISIKGVDYHLSKAMELLRKSLKDYFPVIVSFFISLF